MPEYQQTAQIPKPAFSTDAIIAAAAAIFLFFLLTAPLWVPGFFGSTKWARVSSTRRSIEKIQRAVDAYEKDAGRAPTEAEGLWALLEKPADLPLHHWKGPYLAKLPKDSWGGDFRYVPSPHGFTVISAGRDQKFGTQDDITE